MMKIAYPRSVDVEQVFTQETLDRLTASLFAWQQGVGQIGGLQLHSCWGETSVLSRRYQGQTVYMYHMMMPGVMRLYETTRSPRWQRIARDIVANLMYLQSAGGGFPHAAAEAEPAYLPERTCPIHQFTPVHVLLDYAAWPHAEEAIRYEIRAAVDRHWVWSLKTLWRNGNAWIRPLDFAGWCGVTNQDLVAIASLARYAEVFGDARRFDEFGRPSLDVYLSPHYWHRAIGLTERGDQPNFVERTAYYEWILTMLQVIHRFTGEDRIAQLIANISQHLFDAAFEHEDGHLHLAWGAKTHPTDKSIVLEWTRWPITLSAYPGLLRHLRVYADRAGDTAKSRAVERLERTLASYVLGDGMIPGALSARDPIFSIVTSPASGSLTWWSYLIERLGDRLRDPDPNARVPVIRRTRGNLRWRSNHRLWSIDRDGQRLFAGFKRDVGAVAIGDEPIPGVDLAELDSPELVEEVPF